jgi:hypothetical protein
MKNISKKRNYKLTGNTARIKTGSVWPSYAVIAFLFFIVGFGSTFYIFDGGKSINFLLKIDELGKFNSVQDKELLELKLELQMSQISYEKIATTLKEAKEENTKLKESVLFYEKIIGKRK